MRSLLEVALHSGVYQGSFDGSKGYFRVGMTEMMDADSTNKVVFDAAIFEFDEWAISYSRRDVRVKKGGTANFLEFSKGSFVGLQKVFRRRSDGN